MKIHSGVLKSISCFLFIIILCSCSVGRKHETVIYALRPEVAKVDHKTCNNKSDLQIIEPSSVTGLESRRIAILQKNNHLNYYRDIRWAAPLSEMLQISLADAFERSNIFNSVGTDMDDISPDFVLTTDIRDFQVNQEKEPSYAQIRFVSKLIRTKDHKIIATIPIENNMIPNVYKMDSIIASFNNGLTKSITEVVRKSSDSLPCNNN